MLTQLHLFEPPKRKLTRKRIERIERAHDDVFVRAKMPDAPLWRRLTKQGMFVLPGFIEKLIPRANPKQPSERTLHGRSVFGQVDATIDAWMEDIHMTMVEHFDRDERRTGKPEDDRRSWGCDRRKQMCVLDEGAWKSLNGRRFWRTPLYKIYPLLNRRWQSRRKLDGRNERRKGVDRRK